MNEGRAVAVRLGRDVRLGRHRARLTQRDIAATVGVDQATISRIELGLGGNIDLTVWAAVAHAVHLDLSVTHGSRERPAGGHKLIAATATSGGWLATTNDDETVLTRGADRIVMHVWSVVTNVETDVDRLMASVLRETRTTSPAGGRVSGLVLIPAAEGNRRRVSEQRFALREIFTATGRAWYRCLIHPGLPMPTAPGILWTFRDFERFRPAPDLPGWIWTKVGDGPRFATGRRQGPGSAG